jgi:hypothetical protein
MIDEFTHYWQFVKERIIANTTNIRIVLSWCIEPSNETMLFSKFINCVLINSYIR